MEGSLSNRSLQPVSSSEFQRQEKFVSRANTHSRYNCISLAFYKITRSDMKGCPSNRSLQPVSSSEFRR